MRLLSDKRALQLNVLVGFRYTARILFAYWGATTLERVAGDLIWWDRANATGEGGDSKTA